MAGIQSGAIHVVNELVSAGCNPNAEDLLGQTPKDYAAKNTNVSGKNFVDIIEEAKTKWQQNQEESK